MIPKLTPEQKSRNTIGRKILATGWIIQNMKTLNLSVNPVSVAREDPTDVGYSENIFSFVRKPFGVIVVKCEEGDYPLPTLRK